MKNDDLSTWARLEGSGYDDKNDLPEYRKINVQVLGKFLGPFGSGLDNAPIPPSAIDKKHRDGLFTALIFQPVGELEQLAGGSDSLRQNWPADVVAYYQNKPIYSNGLALGSAWRVLSRSTFSGMLEAIRTRVLDFALKIESELGEEVGNEGIVEIQPSKVNQIFNTTINGGNVAISGSGHATQIIDSVKVGNLGSLSEALRKIGIDEADIEDATKAIGDPKLGKPSQEIWDWLRDMKSKGADATGRIATGAAGGILARVILAYYGLS